MSYQADFGAALKRLRLAKNYSQIELAKFSSIDRTFISLLERGVRQPSLTTIIELAAALKIKPSQLMSEVENETRRKRWRRIKQ